MWRCSGRMRGAVVKRGGRGVASAMKATTSCRSSSGSGRLRAVREVRGCEALAWQSRSLARRRLASPLQGRDITRSRAVLLIAAATPANATMARENAPLRFGYRQAREDTLNCSVICKSARAGRRRIA